MKKLLGFLLLLILSFPVLADHITGGSMSYTFISSANGMVTYRVIMKQYMRCNSGREFNNPSYLAVFHRFDNSKAQDITVPLTRQETISLTDNDPCISNPPTVCYEIGYYEIDVTLPVTGDGYIIAGQVNFRIAGISNLVNNYSEIGATYTAEIPGTANGKDYFKNSSAVFTGSDLVVVCANNPISYSFAVTDPDGDDIRYSFCQAYKSSSGPSIGGNNATPPLAPPYESVPYGNGFNFFTPLGPNVHLDNNTGLITGIAPAPGIYVITVCAEELRNGKSLGTQRKDLQIAIANCNITAAVLPPEIMLCRDTKSITLVNQSASSLINEYSWEINNQSGNTIFASKAATPSFTFADTGLYTAKLVINPHERCIDSTTALVRVYPGFKPALDYSGICFSKPTIFNDKTTSVYGKVNFWRWQFDEIATSDTSNLANTPYTYQTVGVHHVTLVAGDSKGCRDSAVIDLEILEKPPMQLAFRDTLICPPDQLQLKIAGQGLFTWSPASQLIDPGSQNPFIAPLQTTQYYVDLDFNGCPNRDSVLVRVTSKVDLKLMNDTTICTGDPVQLNLESNGLIYRWSPVENISNPSLNQPIAITKSTTTYTVVASISNCTASGKINVNTVDYPSVDAGTDTLVCFKSQAQLRAISDGSNFLWSPQSSLTSPVILDPIASPANTTTYVLQVTDIKGCPKPGYDSVTVSVLSPVHAEVTGDTSVVLGESIQLSAKGGSRYLWQPPSDLSATNIPDPVVSFEQGTNAVRYEVMVFNEAGCYDSAFITLKVYETGPTVFVPSGFTPNGDGLNDFLRPIAVGMKSIEKFVIFNRYGQQVFFSKGNGMGWDGRINGQIQQTGSFIWIVQAIDYNGKAYTNKGTVTLIR